jgi:DNA topoisomerase-1
LFLAASKFPKNRETRPPFLDELLPHQGEIDPKYHFLFDAPLTDDAGNRTQIRYSRKTKEQYVMTDVEGKATGWKAFFDGGAWQTSGTAKVVKKKAAPKKKAKAKAKKKVAGKKASVATSAAGVGDGSAPTTGE